MTRTIRTHRSGAEQSGWALVAVDLLPLCLVTVLALSPLDAAFADRRWLVVGLVGLLIAAGTTLLARALRWGPLLTLLTLAVGYLLIGPAAAAPQQAVAGFLPGLDAIRLLVTGVVESWRSVLTLPVPLGSTRGELVVPLLVSVIGGAVATTMLWRSRWAGGAAVAVLGMFVVSAAFGVQGDDLPIVRALLLGVVLLAWLRWRALRSVRTSWIRRVALGTAVAGLAGVAAWGCASLADPHREVMRDYVVPPMAELALKSPLARYRDYYKNHKTDVLFTFTGLPAGEPLVRLASMDSFDGVVWNVATSDVNTGTSAFRPAPASRSGAAVEVEIGEYAGPWVPTVGVATGATLTGDADSDAERELLINTATGSLAEYGNTRSGDVYRIDWTPREDRTNELLAAKVDRAFTVTQMSFPPIEKLDALAQSWISKSGARTDFERAVALEKGFRQAGYYNDGLKEDAGKRGASASGHGAKRLADLVADETRMVGNDEQYASAMAYVAQRMGLPARVVLGFEKVGSEGAVTGDDIAAWVEIPFERHGWVPFDPTPPEDKIPPPQQDSNVPVPQPYVVQPPVLPQEPADVQGVPPEGAGRDLADRLWDVILMVLRVFWKIILVLLWLAPLWLILLYKAVTRHRRKNAPDPLDRISGAWREMTDRARDLGARIPTGNTRHETSVVVGQRFPSSEPTGLAAVADRHVFGPGTPHQDDIKAYWTDVESALKRMRADAPWWRRHLGWFSLASIPWREVGQTSRTRAVALGARAAAPVRRIAQSRRVVRLGSRRTKA